MLHDSHSIGPIMQKLQPGSDADTRLSPVQFFLWLAAADWSLALFQAIPAAFGADYASTVTQFVSLLANEPIWSICLNTIGLATDPDRITSLMNHILSFKPNFQSHILMQRQSFPTHMSLLLCTNPHDHAVSMCLFSQYDLPLIDQIKDTASERGKFGRAILEFCFRGHNGEYLPVLYANELLDTRELGQVLNRVVMHNTDPTGLRVFVAGTSTDLLGEIVCQGINNLASYITPNLDYYASMANMLHASTMPFFGTIASRANWWGLEPEIVVEVLFDVARDQLAVPWDYDKLRAELNADLEMADKFAVVATQIERLSHLW